MKKLLTALLTLLLTCSLAGARQAKTNLTKTGEAKSSATSTTAARKRRPIFRATKDQVTQAQNALKQQGHYAGEATGKLDDATRAGLKKYQAAVGLKETGTLNRVTLEKMNITLTDKQKAM